MGVFTYFRYFFVNYWHTFSLFYYLCIILFSYETLNYSTYTTIVACRGCT